MTDADKATFAQAFNRLVAATREKDIDTMTMRVYFDALKTCEVEFIVAAADRLIVESKWFPRAAEWLAMARTIDRERVEAHRAQLHGCASCGGSGWLRVGPGTTAGGGFAAERVQQCACTKLQRQRLLESMRRCEELERPDAIRENA